MESKQTAVLFTVNRSVRRYKHHLSPISHLHPQVHRDRPSPEASHVQVLRAHLPGRHLGRVRRPLHPFGHLLTDVDVQVAKVKRTSVRLLIFNVFFIVAVRETKLHSTCILSGLDAKFNPRPASNNNESPHRKLRGPSSFKL